MKLDYNILCIDDELSSLREPKRKFSALNARAGIEVHYRDINAHAGPRETVRGDYLKRLHDEITKAFAENTFEIILIDLHLKNGVEGHELIQFIRNTHSLYRPVIFYSAGSPRTMQGALDQLTEAARVGGILGRNILITHRNSVSDTLAEIAREMHREEHKINQVRGLLMDQVSEFDAMVIRAVSSPQIWEAIPAPHREKLLAYARNEIHGKRLDTAMKGGELLKGRTYDEMKEHFSPESRLFDTSQKTRFLKKMLTLAGLNAEADLLQEFIADGGLNSVRNNYAHQTAAALDASHSPEKCVEIRGHARKQISNIRSILDRFS